MKRISTSAINMIMAYHWPGNVRELENCLERSVLTSADGVIHGFNLPPSLQTSEETHTGFIPDEGANLKQMVEGYEREILIDALKNIVEMLQQLRAISKPPSASSTTASKI